MSFYFPHSGIDATRGTGLRLDLPAGVSRKAQNAGFVLAFFIRTLGNYAGTKNRGIIVRSTGSGSSNGGFVFRDGAAGTLTASMLSGGSNFFAGVSVPVAGEKTYLAILAISATGKHMAVCEPGQSPVVAYTAHNANNPWSNLGFSNLDLATSFGCGTATATGSADSWVGPLENVCLWQGTFVESSANVLDATRIAEIAAGTRSLDTLHTDGTIVAGGGGAVARKWRYRLADRADLADAWGLAGNLTLGAVDVPSDRVAYSGGPLLPGGPLRPNYVDHTNSQVVFARPGDRTSAFADIVIEGGTYSGIVPTRIEARLVNQAGSVVRDWTTVDAAPTGGAWASSVLTAVPITDGWMSLEFRAMSGSTVLAQCPSYGFKGAGFNFLGSGQSQFTALVEQSNPWSSGITPVTAGGRVLVQQVNGGPGAAVYRTAILTDNSAVGRANIYGGASHIIAEINALYPGVPISFGVVGEQSTSLVAFYDDVSPPRTGERSDRWGIFRAGVGLMQPYYLVLMQHISGSDADYERNLGRMITFAVAQLGRAPIKSLHISVSRWRKGTNLLTEAGRDGARAYCLANPETNMWSGSLSTVECYNASGAPETALQGDDPHPAQRETGRGRSGATIARMVLSASRAVLDRPVGITRVRAVGADAVIEFGPIDT